MKPPDTEAREVPHNKSLLRSGGQWYLVCESLDGLDKLPMISLSVPPGAELRRYTAEPVRAVE